MSHDAFRALLAARQDLSSDEAATLQEHLRDCAECRGLAEQYAQQDVFLRALPAGAPPVRLRQEVFARLDRPSHRRLPLPGLRRALLFAPGTVVVLIAVLALVHSGHPRASSSASFGPLSHSQKGQTNRSTAKSLSAGPFVPAGVSYETAIERLLRQRRFFIDIAVYDDQAGAGLNGVSYQLLWIAPDRLQVRYPYVTTTQVGRTICSGPRPLSCHRTSEPPNLRRAVNSLLFPSPLSRVRQKRGARPAPAVSTPSTGLPATPSITVTARGNHWVCPLSPGISPCPYLPTQLSGPYRYSAYWFINHRTGLPETMYSYARQIKGAEHLAGQNVSFSYSTGFTIRLPH